MKKREFSKLVEKYTSGKCSPHETKLLEDYLDSFQNNADSWNEDEMGKQWIVEAKIFAGIMRNMGKDKTYSFTRAFYSPALLKRAASIIFFIIVGSGILYMSGIFNQETNSAVWYEKITSSGEKTVLSLSDGSTVNLNAGSKLRYPEEFNGATREVYLEGEGYFTIYHNVNKPFIVHTENLTTTVLGTKFDVSAYPENNTIAVSLLEGKVKVSSSEWTKTGKEVILKPKEKLLYDKGSNRGSLATFDSLKAIGWKDGVYKFENEPLSEVLAQLERAFGVEFKLTDQSVLSQKITIKFENGTLETVVEVIKSLTGLNYKLIKESNGRDKVSFYGNTK